MLSPYRTGAEVKEEKPQPFPLEKILTMSAQDYVGPGVRVTDKYEVRGVHWARCYNTDGEGSDFYIQKFAERVPPQTEVVVNRQITISSRGTSYDDVVEISGTALIPKQNYTQSTSPR